MPITLLIGASTNPERYAYKALLKLITNGHQVIAVSPKKGAVLGVIFEELVPPGVDVDTVTLYVNPLNQKKYYEAILKLKPRRVIFNPGTENEEFASLLKANKIAFMEACTLVMLSLGIY